VPERVDELEEVLEEEDERELELELELEEFEPCELLDLFVTSLELLDGSVPGSVFSELELSSKSPGYSELLELSMPLELPLSLELLESSRSQESLHSKPPSLELLALGFPSSLFSPEQAKKTAHIAKATKNKISGILFIQPP